MTSQLKPFLNTVLRPQFSIYHEFCRSGKTVKKYHQWECNARSQFLPRYAMHKRGLFAVTQCLSVRRSVTFVDYVKTNKHIFEIFSPSGSDTILVFRIKGGADIPTGTPLTRASNARGYEKSRFSTIVFTNISLYLKNGYS